MIVETLCPQCKTTVNAHLPRGGVDNDSFVVLPGAMTENYFFECDQCRTFYVVNVRTEFTFKRITQAHRV